MGTILEKGFLGIIIALDGIIYGLIGSAFRIFMVLAGARLLTSKLYSEIAQKVYIVIGVLMLFVLAYTLLKAIINPDDNSVMKNGSSIFKGVVRAVVGLALCPVFFNLMYQAQGLILDNDVIAKLFFRTDASSDSIDAPTIDENGQQSGTVEASPNEQVKSIGGSVTATTLWQAFFHPVEGVDAKDVEVDVSTFIGSAIGSSLVCATLVTGSVFAISIPLVNVLLVGTAALACLGAASSIKGAFDANSILNDGKLNLADAYNLSASGNGFSIYGPFLDLYLADGDGKKIDYYWGLSTVAGAFTLYAFCTFSIDMGLRAAKLAYLQIVAPIPLIMGILPDKQKNFSNYVETVLKTFADVFIRMSVVYVVVFIICHLTDVFNGVSGFWSTSGLNIAEKLFALAFLILGLIAFTKEAPKFVSQSLSLKGDGNIGLGLKDTEKKLANGGLYAAGSIVGAGAQSAVQGFKNSKGTGFWGRANGLIRGGATGAGKAAYLNFGPRHNRAATYADMKSFSSKAAEETADKMAHVNDRYKKNRDAAQRVQTYKNELADLRERKRQAVDNHEPESVIEDLDNQIIEKNRLLADAQAYEKKNTATSELYDNIHQKVQTWSTGTVSVKQYTDLIDFGGKLKDIKDSLRDIAAKKGDADLKSLIEEYESLKGKKLSEWREGYSEEDYNKAFQEETERNEAFYRSELASATTDDERRQAREDYEQGKAAITSRLNAQYKYSAEEMYDRRVQLQNDIKMAKDLAESAQDAWVVEQLNEPNSEVSVTLAQTLNKLVPYMASNSDKLVYTGVDDDHPITIRELVTKNFGAGVLSGGRPERSSVTSNADMSFDFVDENGAAVKYTYKYDPASKNYVCTDANGQPVTTVGEHNDGVVSRNEAIAFMKQVINRTKGKGCKVTTNSAVGVVSDYGKGTKNYVSVSEDYRNGLQRQRAEKSSK